MKKFLILSLPFFITLICTETVLRFSPYRALLLRPHIQLEKNLENQFYLADDILGYRIRPSARGPLRVFPYDGIRYVPFSNEIGCYDSSIKNIEIKRAGLIIGDSFTFGTHELEYGWPRLLEKLSAEPILKCGIDSYGTKQELEWLKRVINELKEKPKYIILQYYVGNDMFDDYLNPAVIAVDGQKISRFDLSRTNFSTGETVTRSKEDIVSQLNQEILEQPSVFARHSVIIALIEGALSKRGISSIQIPTKTSSSHSPSFITFDDTNRPWLKKAWEDHVEVLKNFKLSCDALNIPLYIVMIPANDQVYPFLLSQEEQEIVDLLQPNHIVGSFLKENKIEHYDMLNDLRKFANQEPRAFLDPRVDLYNKVDGHFSLVGEELASILIAKYLAEKNVFEMSHEVLKASDSALRMFDTKYSQHRKSALESQSPQIESYGPVEVLRGVPNSSSPVAFWIKVSNLKNSHSVKTNAGSVIPVKDLTSAVITFEVPWDRLQKIDQLEVKLYDKVLGLESQTIRIPITRNAHE